MNVYADILSSVLNDWVDELGGDALIEFAGAVSGANGRVVPHSRRCLDRSGRRTLV